MSLPTPFPGETAFSFTARVMLRSGAHSRGRLLRHMGVTASALWSPFGMAISGLFRAFSDLNSFVSPADFLWFHTTSPLIVAFSGRVGSEAERAEFCSRALAANAWVVGPHSCRCLRPSGLRECPVCREEDVKRCGLAYWHREHQVRPVSLCWRHGVALREHAWAPGHGFELELPGFGRYAKDAPTVRLPPMSSRELDAWMAKAIANVLDARATHDVYARQVLTTKAVSTGLYTRGVPDLKKVHDHVVHTVGAPYLESLGYATEYSPKRAARFARPVCRRESVLDPVLTLLLAASLGVGHDELTRSPREKKREPSIDVGASVSDTPEAARIRDALKSNGYVLSRTAAQLGVSWSVLTTMIADQRIVCPIVTGPHSKFDKAAIEAMILALKGGESWAQVKQRFGCGDHQLGTLKVYDAALQESATNARRERLIEKYRDAVTRTLAADPMLSRTEVRARLVTELSYLGRHDKVWIRSQLDRVPRRRPALGSQRRERRRDRDLDRATAEAVRRAMTLARALRPPRRLTRTLLLRLGGVPASIHTKLVGSRLPKTCALLMANEESRASYFVRRLEFALAQLAREERSLTLIRLRRASGLSEAAIVENRSVVQRLVGASHLPVSRKAVAWLRDCENGPMAASLVH